MPPRPYRRSGGLCQVGALVTGGSRGIGAAIALALSENGADVAFTFQSLAERLRNVKVGPLAKGAFFRPALLGVSDNSLAIIQEETFGPVLTIQRFSNEAEAIQLANDSEYGLSASIWTRDVDRSLRVAQAIEAGSVWINDWATVYDGTEEGGFKQSGLGRLSGLVALDDFVEHKHIALKPGLKHHRHFNS